MKKISKSSSDNKSIKIIRPDKEQGILILDKFDYNKKMSNVLNNNNNTFQFLESDPPLTHEDKH